MIRLFAIPARVKLWLAALVAALGATLGIYIKGRSDEAGLAKLRNLKAHKETVERVLDETDSDDTADFVRKRMRERARKP